MSDAEARRTSEVPESAPHDLSAQAAEIDAVQRWRRRVVRLWVATMLTAIMVWALVAAAAVPRVVELCAAALLATLAGASVWHMHRGMCPRCGRRIRFQPRIELPLRCPHCSAPFFASP